MCTVLIGFAVRPDLPIIVAANRDEYFGRPAQAPGVLIERPRVIGGRDLSAGGTWLGLNPWGVVGLTNQPTGVQVEVPGAGILRSRGLLVLDALQAVDPPAAVALARPPAGSSYMPFNLFAVSRDALYVAYHRGESTRIERLEPGWHVIPNGEADNRRIPKVERAFHLLEALSPDLPPDRLAGALRQILADHDHPPAVPDEPGWLPETLRRAIGALCVHSEFYGTRSYSILEIDAAGQPSYWHGEGPPCTTALQPVAIG